MGEGLFRRIAGDRYEVASAGIDGYWDTAQPATIATMREKGIDISGHACRNVTEFAHDEFEAVFTLDGSVVPVVVSTLKNVKEFVHWEIPDPYLGTPESYRRVRDVIEHKILGWLDKKQK
jgi:arsenate reductase